MTEEAKKIVEALRICHSNEDCRDCKFIDSDKDEMSCVNVLFVKAADLIESLSEQLEQVTSERDAAIRDFTEAMKYSESCMFCKYLSGTDDEVDCNKPKIMPCENCWQWRGVEVTDNAQKGSDAKS